MDVLCHDFPIEFGTFLDYTLGLSFDEEPDYCYLRNLFCDLFAWEAYHNHVFDWSTARGEGDGSRSALVYLLDG